MKMEEIGELREQLRQTLQDNPGVWYDVSMIHDALPSRIPKHFIDWKGALTTEESNIERRMFNGHWAWAYFAPDGPIEPADYSANAKHFGHRESPEHLKLKNYVAANPQSLGLPKSAKPDIEHTFLSPDRADVVFDIRGTRWVAVEVELQGELNTLVGAWQALKYRLLLCLEHGLDTASEQVEAVLVAHQVPESTRQFCTQHDIRTVEIQL